MAYSWSTNREEARLTYRVSSWLRSARDDLLTNHETHKQRERLLELKQRIGLPESKTVSPHGLIYSCEFRVASCDFVDVAFWAG